MAFLRKKNKPSRSNKVRYIDGRSTDTRSEIDPTVAMLIDRIDDLTKRLNRLEQKNTEWMKISDAVQHPSLAGRLSQKQIRTQIFNSIEDPITATFVVNVHYQLLRGSSYRSYMVNPSAIAKLLESSG